MVMSTLQSEVRWTSCAAQEHTRGPGRACTLHAAVALLLLLFQLASSKVAQVCLHVRPAITPLPAV